MQEHECACVLAMIESIADNANNIAARGPTTSQRVAVNAKELDLGKSTDGLSWLTNAKVKRVSQTVLSECPARTGDCPQLRSTFVPFHQTSNNYRVCYGAAIGAYVKRQTLGWRAALSNCHLIKSFAPEKRARRRRRRARRKWPWNKSGTVAKYSREVYVSMSAVVYLIRSQLHRTPAMYENKRRRYSRLFVLSVPADIIRREMDWRTEEEREEIISLM